MTNRNKKPKKVLGFTIVELVICIAVVAILAAVSIVAYRGVQERARDTQRMADVQRINDALQVYVLNNRRAPMLDATRCTPAGKEDTGCYANDMLINGSPSPYWTSLQNDLKPYFDNKNLPIDPCGLKCFQKGASKTGSSTYNNGGFYTYRYVAPAYYPAYPIGGKTVSATDFSIYAENLEAKTSGFGYGFGSF